MVGVSKCSVEPCTFNENMECKAPSITVDWLEDHADCDTFRPKMS